MVFESSVVVCGRITLRITMPSNSNIISVICHCFSPHLPNGSLHQTKFYTFLMIDRLIALF